MTSVPSGWPNVPLEEVLDFQEGPGIMARDFRQEGVPLIRLSGLKRGSPLLAGCNFLESEKVSRQWGHFRLQQGDVLLSTSASLGETSTVDASGVGAIAYTGIIRFRPKGDRILGRYIPHALTTPTFKQQIEAMGGGSVIRHFGPTHLRLMTVCIPPLSEQQAITEVLGALDDKITANERIADTALDLAEALYVRDSADEQGWRETALADTAMWKSGGTPKTSEPSYWNGDIPWISAASLKSPWLDDSERKVTQLGSENGTRLVPAGTIIFVVRGMSLISEFRVGLTQREVAFGQDCKALLPRPGVDPVVLLLALRSRTREILNLVDTAGHGTGRLSTDRIEKLRIRLPSGEAGTGFTNAVRSLAGRASAAKHENRILSDLRNFLLPLLTTGQIRVKDAVRVLEDVAS